MSQEHLTNSDDCLFMSAVRFDSVILLFEFRVFFGFDKSIGLMGIPIGALVLKGILRGLGQTLSQGIEIPVVISSLGILFSYAVAVIVFLFSAWLPVRRASPVHRRMYRAWKWL